MAAEKGVTGERVTGDRAGGEQAESTAGIAVLAPHRSPITPIRLHLRSGKDHPVRLGHPWIFSGAIKDLDAKVEPGSIAHLYAADGDFLGVAYVNPRCTIAARMLARTEQAIDAAFLRRRVAAALALRRRTVADNTTAYRLINGEGDQLPGVLVDRYGDVLVVQCLTAGAERLQHWLLDALVAELSPRAIVERSEGSVRRAEGLAPRAGTLHGDPPAEVTVQENGLRFVVAPGADRRPVTSATSA